MSAMNKLLCSEHKMPHTQEPATVFELISLLILAAHNESHWSWEFKPFSCLDLAWLD